MPLELHSGHFNITITAGIKYKFSLSAIDFYWNKSKGIGVANTRPNVYHTMSYSIHY